ncbi:MAG TPA: NRDE family protein, partial [Saprospiraceae bacterium]|nr:NRDE family protein [Saprospiraceae bacterium]
MCTVTFIPFGQTIFITSNRDESPSRHARGLMSRHEGDLPPIHFPLDEESQGSWIALADTGRSVCLLNGGFVPFIPDPPYRMSRGRVVMDAAGTTDLDVFLEQYNLEGIAPFTLLIYEDDRFMELVWDGFHRHIKSLSTEVPQLWSSVTLYPPEIREWRQAVFQEWLQERKAFDRESIMAFHNLKKGDATNDFIMNRGEIVKTLSITNIQLGPAKGSMLHLDLEKN